MAANAKTIRRRIKSIANTGKITKAMELVAASKMQRAVNSVLGTRPYARMAWETINAVAKSAGEVTHPLLVENKEAKKTLFILFTSDRGLAGALNTNMNKAAAKAVAQIKGDIEAIAVGKRGNAALRRANVPVIASFEGLTNKPMFKDVLPIGTLVLEEYQKGTYKDVIIGYTDFISALNQIPKILKLLPLGQPEDMEGLGEVGNRTESENVVTDLQTVQNYRKDESREYKFEPSPEEVLNRILPRLVETMIYQALLESAASEHSARMMAMRSASDNAQDMLKELTLTYNQIRQAGITQEIAEISGGAAAINNK
ncbi:MAG: ATP synthase F1 subunit gamma [Candidatus Uhrbacteria bacterium]|nr:ATP synthase F1 subunit gamma [Candidatus Uhrbacteria bacterium]